MGRARRVIDISLGIEPAMLAWPGDPPVHVRPTARVSDGDPANVSELRLSTHTGTHVDPPSHLFDGELAVDTIDLSVLVGEAIVADLRGVSGEIAPADLEALGLDRDVERLLLRTDNSSRLHEHPAEFPTEYVCLSAESADWVVARGIRLVGIDSLSIEAFHAPGHPVHRRLLGAGIVIAEGLDLRDAEPGSYGLACLPLKVLGADGAPARAVLFDTV